MTAFKYFSCQKKWLLQNLHNYWAESSPIRGCQTAITAQLSQVKVKYTSFLGNDSSELVRSSPLAECRGKCLFLLCVLGESGWRSAQEAILWPFFTVSTKTVSVESCGKNEILGCFLTESFSGCESVLATHDLLIMSTTCYTLCWCTLDIDLSYTLVPFLIAHWSFWIRDTESQYIIKPLLFDTQETQVSSNRMNWVNSSCRNHHFSAFNWKFNELLIGLWSCPVVGKFVMLSSWCSKEAVVANWAILVRRKHLHTTNKKV